MASASAVMKKITIRSAVDVTRERFSNTFMRKEICCREIERENRIMINQLRHFTTNQDLIEHPTTIRK